MSEDNALVNLRKIPGGVCWKFNVAQDPNLEAPSTDIDYTQFRDFETNVLEFFKPKECDVCLELFYFTLLSSS
jgi:hypothetical protein